MRKNKNNRKRNGNKERKRKVREKENEKKVWTNMSEAFEVRVTVLFVYNYKAYYKNINEHYL